MRVVAWLLGALLFVVGVGSGLLLLWEAWYAGAPGAISGSITLNCVTTSDTATSCTGPTTSGSHVQEVTTAILYATVAVAGVVGGAVLMAAGMLAGRRRPVAPVPPVPGVYGPPAPGGYPGPHQPPR
ncbi:hypothetical protein GCM10028777_04730 [Angustibacter speluncae]